MNKSKSVLLSCFQLKMFDSSNASKCLASIPLQVSQSKNVYCSEVSHLPVVANVRQSDQGFVCVVLYLSISYSCRFLTIHTYP